ncbi:MAG: YwiC-like family protein [Clostridia bacterium]|nr:YwiC-like family protein [Clostridia bacterium]
MKSTLVPRKKRKIFLSMFLHDNLVLVQAIGLCPIIAGGTTLKRAVALTVCTFLALVPTSFLMSLIGKRLPRDFHPPLYALLSMGALFGIAYLLNTYVSTELYASLYLFLPLLAINTLLAYHNDSRPPHLGLDILESFATTLGFGVVICVVGAIREVVALNSIWNIPLSLQIDFPEITVSFSAFILVGLMAACLQWIKNKSVGKTAEEEVEEE